MHAFWKNIRVGDTCRPTDVGRVKSRVFRRTNLIRLLAFFVLIFSGSQSAWSLSVIRGPYLQQLTDKSAIVRWRTDQASDSEVKYGLNTENLDQSSTNTNFATDHEVVVEGLLEDLSPNTTYFYSVGSTEQTLAGGDADHFFKTAPDPDVGTSEPTRLWVLGDSGTADSNAVAVRNAYLDLADSSNKADLLLMLGDNAYNRGRDREYQKAVFDTYPSILRNTPLWPTLGNHDGYTADSSTQSGPYYDIFSLPTGAEAGGVASGTEAYYSFDYANIHFVVLDSYETDRTPDGLMLPWLGMDLADTMKEWIIAFWHHPPYSKGSHDSDTEGRLIDMRQNVLPILEDYGVDLVLSGHSHSYERSMLLDGHYGQSNTLDLGPHSTMIVDSGDGRKDGDGAYAKNPGAIHDGAVYVVAGSSGKTSGGSLDHPAMYISMNNLGSMVIDINGNRLDAMFLRENGTIPDHFTITKGGDINLPPGQASSPSPADNSIGVPTSAQLTWNAGINSDSHELYFGTDSSPPPIINQVENPYDPDPLENGMTYYWRIDEVNEFGTTEGEIWNFTTVATPAPPGVASNPAPTDGASNQSVSTTLSWVAGSQTSTHVVYFGEGASPPIVSSQSNTEYDPGALDPDTTYHWKVDEINDVDTTPGPLWSFTTSSAQIVCASSESVTLSRDRIEWFITNNTAGPITIDTMSISWLAQHQNLKEINLGATRIFNTLLPPVSATINVNDWIGEATDRQIGANETAEIEIVFAKKYGNHQLSDFDVSISYAEDCEPMNL